MMDFEFIDTKNDTHVFHVSEKVYEQLFNLGIDKITQEEEIEIRIEGELYTIKAIRLNNDNRRKLKSFLLEQIFDKIEDLYGMKTKLSSQDERIRLDINFMHTVKELIKGIDNKENEWFQLNP